MLAAHRRKLTCDVIHNYSNGRIPDVARNEATKPATQGNTCRNFEKNKIIKESFNTDVHVYIIHNKFDYMCTKTYTLKNLQVCQPFSLVEDQYFVIRPTCEEI